MNNNNNKNHANMILFTQKKNTITLLFTKSNFL